MIHVAGAGWYGCHLMASLQAVGLECVGWEAEDDFMLGSSGFNQNRLHLGFHYPRNHVTRSQSRAGFQAFLSKYPDLARPVARNTYAIAFDSNLDFRSYSAIFRHEGYGFTEVSPGDLGVLGCDGAIFCDEQMILHRDVKRFWSHANLPIQFRESVSLREGVLYSSSGGRLSLEGDIVIDCTWGSLTQPEGFYREHFLTFVVQCDLLGMGALTVMDGHFFSIFPLQTADGGDNVYTLTHVKFGVVRSTKVAHDEVTRIFSKIVGEVQRFSPAVAASLKMEYYFISDKLKPYSRSDSRDVRVLRSDNVISVISGKIDAVFTAEETVLDLLKDTFDL